MGIAPFVYYLCFEKRINTTILRHPHFDDPAVSIEPGERLRTARFRFLEKTLLQFLEIYPNYVTETESDPFVLKCSD